MRVRPRQHHQCAMLDLLPGEESREISPPTKDNCAKALRRFLLLVSTLFRGAKRGQFVQAILERFVQTVQMGWLFLGCRFPPQTVQDLQDATSLCRQGAHATHHIQMLCEDNHHKRKSRASRSKASKIQTIQEICKEKATCTRSYVREVSSWGSPFCSGSPS